MRSQAYTQSSKRWGNKGDGRSRCDRDAGFFEAAENRKAKNLRTENDPERHPSARGLLPEGSAATPGGHAEQCRQEALGR